MKNKIILLVMVLLTLMLVPFTLWYVGVSAVVVDVIFWVLVLVVVWRIIVVYKGLKKDEK